MLNIFSDTCDDALKVQYAGKKRYIKLNGASCSTFLRQGNVCFVCAEY